jgi:DNA-binding transcriptional LysR family regulator
LNISNFENGEDMKNLNLRQLYIFKVVGRHLSFSRAAEELYLSQPAVSQHIRQLEEYYGVKLFDQVGKQVVLTEVGTYLMNAAQQIFNQVDEIHQTISDLQNLRRGSLTVTADTAAGVYVVPPLLGWFHRAHPLVNIKLEVVNRRTVLQSVLKNETDLAVMGYPEQSPNLVADPFADNNLVVIASSDHPLAERSSINLQEYAEEPFLIREPGSGTRITLEKFATTHGITLNVSMELGNNSAIKEAVAAGLGISVVSEATIILELKTKKLTILPVDHFPIVRQWFVVHSTQRALSPLAANFRETLLNSGLPFTQQATKQ